MGFHPKRLSLFRDKTLPIVLQLLKDLDTPRSLGLALALSASIQQNDSEAFVSLCSMNFPFDAYLSSDVDKFRRDYQASVLLSKLPNITDHDLELEAIKAFEAAEDHCREVNNEFTRGQIERVFDQKTGVSLFDIKKTLRRLLGRAPSWGTVLENGGWGPGSSWSLSQRKASPVTKCEYETTITFQLAKEIQAYSGLFPWLNKPWQLVPGNLVTTVSKNVKTDRTIAIEPGINSWCQKGLGNLIRRRLRKYGIDLNNQNYNALAALCALDDGLCTVDLKAASDTISWELVRAVLPHDWLLLIEATRSPLYTFCDRTDANKSWSVYQKVSSMGNGFTFELESAIFYAILLVCGVPPCRAYVYGDDLIFPSRDYDKVVNTLTACGFSVNDEKSFRTGLFYESCGTYAFNGVDVTPLKIKELINGPKDAIILANKIRLFAHLCCGNYGCDRRYLASWRLSVSGIPERYRTTCRGPVGGGITLYCNFNESPAASFSKRKYSFRYAALVNRLVEREADYDGLYHYRLYELSQIREAPVDFSSSRFRADLLLGATPIVRSATRSGNVALQFASKRWKSVTTHSNKWYDLGPWI